ncbi:MAG TPA: sulfite exporter TauE/SafE family protein [Moraxellaceae bacterium]|nr:sulfite exporter TauE/SafE family protein [Moraxellaceae bacterium]
MTGTDGALLLTAWATGLLGSTHCVGMCGGISAALSFALPEDARRGGRLFAFQLAYNSGRILTYTLLGLLAGALAQGVLGAWAQSPWPRAVAGGFMVALGLYLAGWWLGLQRLERMGGSLWRHLEPLRKVVFPVNRLWKALLAGGLWGFLPCGLVYSALALSLARADTLVSGGVMLAFGLGTLPALLLTGTFAGRVRALLQQAGARRLAGALVIGFGLWTAVQPFVMKHAHAGHEGAAAPALPMDHGDMPMDHDMPLNHGDMPMAPAVPPAAPAPDPAPDIAPTGHHHHEG